MTADDRVKSCGFLKRIVASLRLDCRCRCEAVLISIGSDEGPSHEEFDGDGLVP